LSSLGVSPWKGVPLFGGYNERIGAREVELDAQIPFSQMPRIIGVSEEAEEAQYDEWEVHSPRKVPGTPLAAAAAASPAPTVLAVKKFVPPATFYGQPSEKSNTKGPR
jgi:DNA repair and recombination protein RAD54B